MARALISINGVDGSNDNLPIDTLVQLNNDNNGSEVSFAWTILDQPPGPPDSLSATNIQNPTITPQKQGTYLFQLVVNGTYTDTAIVGIRQVKTFQRVPAADETTQDDASRGWADAAGSFLQLVDSQYGADYRLIAGVAGGALTRGDVVYLSGESVILSGLPEQETLGQWSQVALSGPNYNLLSSQLGVFETVVSTGATTAVLNDIIFVRVAGIFTGSGLTTSAIGQEIYTSDAGVITTTAGSWPRLVGRALNVSADADIWINPNLVIQPMLLTWGNGTGPAAGQTRYMNPTGYSTGAVSSSQVSFPAPFYGVISNLIVSAATGPTVDSTVFTLNVNGADTALTATMAAGGVLATDYTHLAPVTLAGQIELKAVGGASVGAAATGLVACALFLPNKLTV